MAEYAPRICSKPETNYRLREHPTPETLDRFLRGELPAAEGVGVLEHLVRRCRPCLAAVARYYYGTGEPEDLGDAGEVFDAAFDRAAGVAGKADEDRRKESRRVDEAYAALVAKGEPGIFDPSERRFGTLTYCLVFLRRSWELRHENPTEMLRLARLAEFGSRRLKVERYGEARVADLRARALAELANAQRITGDLTGAERGVREALQLRREGSQDRFLGAHLLTIQATIFGSSRRFPEALELLAKVEKTYAALGNPHKAGQAAVQRGLYTGYAGNAEEAVQHLRRALALIDEDADPQLALAAVHNLARSLAECGDFRAARTLLFNNRARYNQHADHIILLKRTWLEGQIDAGLGNFDRAAKRLAEAMQSLEEAELGYQAALAALDLAAVWLEQNRSPIAATLVEQAAETFAAIGINRELLGALLLLQRACERGRAEAAMVHRLATQLRHLEHDPSARFSSQ